MMAQPTNNTFSGTSARNDMRIPPLVRREFQKGVQKEADQVRQTEKEERKQFSREERAKKSERSRERREGRVGTVRRAAGLALEHRKAIENGEFSVFIPALAFALMKDALFDVIPIVGNLFGLFISVYLFIFLWGKGKWKVRLVIFLLSLVDVIPAVNLIPLSTICVIYAYQQAKKHAHQVKEELAAVGITI